MNEIEAEMSITLANTTGGWTGWVTVGGGDTDLGVYRSTAEEAFELAQRLYDKLLEEGEEDQACPACSGTGEGLYESQRCGACRGTGIAVNEQE